jgi:hypothetical protein
VVSVRPLAVWLAPQWLLIRAARGAIHCDATRSYEFSSPAVRRRFLDRDIRGEDFYPEGLLAGLGADITTGELLWHQAPSRKGRVKGCDLHRPPWIRGGYRAMHGRGLGREGGEGIGYGKEIYGVRETKREAGAEEAGRKLGRGLHFPESSRPGREILLSGSA